MEGLLEYFSQFAPTARSSAAQPEVPGAAQSLQPEYLS